MAKRQTARDRAFVRKAKTLHFPTCHSRWTTRGRQYCSTLVRQEYAGMDPKTGKPMIDPEAFISSPNEAKEVLKRQGRWTSHTEIEARA